MNIVLIDVTEPLKRCFSASGHTILPIHLPGGIFHLPGLLLRQKFRPDFVFQQESLGIRNYLHGLEEIPCLTAFWAIESHLNLYWHQWYSRLFDLVLTPHVTLHDTLPGHLRPPQLRRFAWYGEDRAFVPHDRRQHGIGLCAKLSSQRQIRNWLVDSLSPLGLVHAEGLTHSRMMQLYDQSRTIPNECIANEVNFRLQEGASSGCLVLSPDVGDDQNALFEPGREFLAYEDGLELIGLLEWAGSRPRASEKIGLAARQRVQKEHLPEHRMRLLITCQAEAGRTRLTGLSAAMAFWLTLALQTRAGVLPLEPLSQALEGSRLLEAVRSLVQPTPIEQALAAQTMTQVFCLSAEAADNGGRKQAFSLCLELLDRIREPGKTAVDDARMSLDVLAVMSAFLLREKAPQPAALFRKAVSDDIPERTMDPVGLCLSWARVLEKKGRVCEVGFRFDPDLGMLPESALGWLIFARQFTDGNSAILGPHFDRLLRHMPELLAYRLTCREVLYRGQEPDWRVGCGMGLAWLKAHKVRDGVAMLRSALILAREKGREAAFWARLDNEKRSRDWRAVLEG